MYSPLPPCLQSLHSLIFWGFPSFFLPDSSPSEFSQHQIPLKNRSPDGSEYIIHRCDHTLQSISLTVMYNYSWLGVKLSLQCPLSGGCSTQPFRPQKLFPWQCGFPYAFPFGGSGLLNYCQILSGKLAFAPGSASNETHNDLQLLSKNGVVLNRQAQNAYTGV